MNPEVLVVHKPDALLDDLHQGKVLELFREFVERRGVGMDPAEPLIKRRKRTVVYSTVESAFEEAAHVVYEALDSKITRKPPPLGGVSF